jgi:two-component system cell cycle sensor histidine kinase/response regulator CckA
LNQSQPEPWAMFQDNPCAMWAYDLESRKVLCANTAALLLYGYSEEEFLSLGLASILAEDDIGDFIEAGRTLTPRRSSSRASRYRRKDGAVITSIDRLSTLESSVGKPIVVVSLPPDEGPPNLALRAKDDIYRIVSENSTDIIALIDAEGNLVYASPSHKKQLGHDPAELLGTSMFLNIHPDDVDIVQASWANLHEAGSATASVRVRNASGEYRVLEAVGSFVTFQGSNYVLASARDITERAEAERALRESEEHLSSIIETSLDAVISMDESGMVTGWNHLAEVIFGWTEEEAIGSVLSQLVIPEEYRQAHNEGLKRFLATGQENILNKRVEMTAAKKSGELLPVELTISQARERDRFVFHGFVRDLSAQRRLEEQLLEARKLESIGRLAGGIAHDFNNVLTAILGYAEIAEGHVNDPARTATYLREISKAGEKAASLTAQLLAFARRQIVEAKLIDLNELTRGVESILARLLGEHIKLTITTSPSQLVTRADPGQLEHVLINLATNARDAMPEGGALSIETTVTDIDAEIAERHPGLDPGKYAVLSVSDTGHGMDEQVRGRIFEPFFTTKEVGKGTGLGLATVYGAVKQSGGHISVYSEPGDGTTFRVYLPLHAGDIAPADEAREIESPSGQVSETILLAEDDDAVRQLAATALRENGYVVLSASGAQEALMLADEYDGDIHLLISDVVMPEMRGNVLAEKLLKRRPNSKVLLMSGYTDSDALNRGILENGWHYLQKPFSTSLLANTVREILGQT